MPNGVQDIVLSSQSLIVLAGPAGAGKSTFAAAVAESNGLPRTAVVSSDVCRLTLCDNLSLVTREQWPSLDRDTFQLYVTIVSMRLAQGRPTIADSLNFGDELRDRARQQLIALAQRSKYELALVLFDFSAETCLAQNAQRPENRRIPESVIRAQRQRFDLTLPKFKDEPWRHIITLNEFQPALTTVIGAPSQ